MEYKENRLCFQDYCNLRKCVGWQNFSEEQANKALERSLYTVTAVENNQTVGMGRLVGDGVYYLMVDIIVHPAYQGKGVGSKIVNLLLQYIDDATPVGGRSSVQLIAEQGKEAFYEKMGFQSIPHEFCGSAMRKILRR